MLWATAAPQLLICTPLQQSTVAMQHLQRRALLPHPDLPSSAHSSGRHSLQALRAADVIGCQLQHAAQRSTRMSLCFSVPLQCCSPQPLQHSSPVHGSSTGGHVPCSCLALHKPHGSEAAHAALLRMPLGFRDVVLVVQLVQAAKRRCGGETMVQVGLPHMRLQSKTPAFHVTMLYRRLGRGWQAA